MDKNNLNPQINAIKRFNSLTSKPSIIRNYFLDFIKNLDEIPIKNKIFSMFLIDQYAINKRHIKILEKNDYFFLSPNHNFFPYLEELSDWAKKEEFFERKK